MSCVTTDPAPILDPRPIVTPGNITTPAPMDTPSSTKVDNHLSLGPGGYLSFVNTVYLSLYIYIHIYIHT